LLGKARQWFYAERDVINTWDNCSKAFLANFFPVGKTESASRLLIILAIMTMQFGRINTFNEMCAGLKD
jgi:hypothetical protein